MSEQASQGRHGRSDASGRALPEPLGVPAFDSHAHLDLLEAPVAQVVADARGVGIDRIVTIGIDLPSSRWSAKTAEQHRDVWAAVAVHPNEAGTADADTLREISKLATLPQVRAVGETGLDHYRDWARRDDQEKSFRAHIDIANQAGKALVIHDREAHTDVLRILSEQGPPERVVFHCFSGDAQLAKVCADAGYYMSFAGNITFKNARDLREAAAVAPAELLLVETDAPFMAPAPHRGKPNAPSLVPFTLRALAQVKGADANDLAAAVAANGERVFGPW